MHDLVCTICRWANARSEGKLMSFDLLDKEGGEIRVTAWNDQVDAYNDLVQVGWRSICAWQIVITLLHLAVPMQHTSTAVTTCCTTIAVVHPNTHCSIQPVLHSKQWT